MLNWPVTLKMEFYLVSREVVVVVIIITSPSSHHRHHHYYLRHLHLLNQRIFI